MMRVGSEGLQTLIRGTGGTIHFKQRLLSPNSSKSGSVANRERSYSDTVNLDAEHSAGPVPRASFPGPLDRSLCQVVPTILPHVAGPGRADGRRSEERRVGKECGCRRALQT